MKAVILEIKNDLAAVLSDDGCIVTVKNNNYEIGQVIQMNNSKLQFTKKIGVFAATAAACVFLSVGAWAYASPYTYVSVDVNPSIEYTVNRFDRVLRVKAVNDDGEEILQEISLSNLKNKTIEEALEATVAQLSEAGYFNGALEGGIVITTASKDAEKADELAQELQQAVETEVAENGDSVVVEALSVTLARVEEAKELGVTPGKLNLVEKLQASAMDPTTIHVEDWLNKSVKEIMKATKDNRKAAVSGSAISVEINDQQKDQTKDQTKEQKLQDQEDQKLQDAEDKALEKAEKEEKKLKAEAEKATEKALAAEEKAKAAADKEKEAEKKLKDAKVKANQKELAAAEDAAKLAQEEADKAKKAKKSADKAAEEATQAAEEATQTAEDATQTTVTDANNAPEQEDNHSKNATNPSNESVDKTIDQSDKSTEKPSVQDDSTNDDVNQSEDNGSKKTDDAKSNSSDTDTGNPGGNSENSNAGGKK